MKHKHADLMAQYAEDALETETPWQRWEIYTQRGWEQVDDNPWWLHGTLYRRKPQTKVIDWGKVDFDIVPIKTADDLICYLSERNIVQWDTLVTGKKIAWTGGECPLPEGVMVSVRCRNGNGLAGTAMGFRWKNDCNDEGGDILWFEVVGLVDGWSWH